MSDSKKWNPIKFSNEEMKEAIALIKRCLVLSQIWRGDEYPDRDHEDLEKKEEDLINRFLQYHEDLSYFQTINTYLWATDVPDKVSDPDKVLFQIKFYEE